MELDNLYESFANFSISDTQSSKPKPYSTEVQLWNKFSEILAKHKIEDVSLAYDYGNLNLEQIKRIGEICAITKPENRELMQDIDEWVGDVKLCLDKRVIEHRNVNFFSSLVEDFKNKKNPSELFGSIFSKQNTPPLSFKSKKLEERFYKKKHMIEYCHQKIDYYSILAKETRQSLLTNLTLPESERDQTKIKKLQGTVLLAQEKLKKWQSKLSHMKSKHLLRKPYQYSQMDKLLGVEFLHTQGFFGRGVKVGVMEGGAASPTRSGHVYHSKVTLKSFQIPEAYHAQHVIGTIAAPAKMVHERLGVAPLSSVSFLNIPKDDVIQCRIEGKDYFYKGQPLDEYVEPVFTITDGLKTITEFKPYTSESKPEGSLYDSDLEIVGGHYLDASDEKLKECFEEAMREGLQIINLSTGLSYGPKSLQALKAFVAQGGVIVKAAGNSGHKLQAPLNPTKIQGEELNAFWGQAQLASSDVGFFKMIKENPELLESTLLVGNLKNESELNKSSCQAGEFAKCYIAAWGTDVLSTASGKGQNCGLGKYSGTSMATPMVTGIVAVLKEAWPEIETKKLIAILLQTATPIGDPETFGMGRLNAEAAFERARESFGPPAKAPPLQRQ